MDFVNIFLKVFFLFFIIVILFSVVFVTLLERKVIGSLNVRVSPDWVVYMGLFQSVVDGLKLVGKKVVLIAFKREMKKDYIISVLLLLVLFFFLWIWYLWGGGIVFFGRGIFWVFFILSCFIYVFLVLRKGRGNKYVLLSIFRVGSQVISYEVNLFFLFMLFIISYWRWWVREENLSLDVKKVFFLGGVFLFLVIREMGRMPLDFLERESELISGVNLEYGGVYFMIVFLVEYGKLIFIIMFILLMLCGICYVIIIMRFIVMNVVVLIRGVFPRFRYDKLMFLCWKDLFFILGVFMNIVILRVLV